MASATFQLHGLGCVLSVARNLRRVSSHNKALHTHQKKQLALRPATEVQIVPRPATEAQIVPRPAQSKKTIQIRGRNRGTVCAVAPACRHNLCRHAGATSPRSAICTSVSKIHFVVPGETCRRRAPDLDVRGGVASFRATAHGRTPSTNLPPRPLP